MNSDPSLNTTTRPQDANIADKWKNLGVKVPFAAVASDGGQPAETPAQQSNENVGQQAVSSTEQPNSHLGEEEKQQLCSNLRRAYTYNLSIILSTIFDAPDDFCDGDNSTLIALQGIVPEGNRLKSFQNFTEMKGDLYPLDDAVKILADAVSESQFADEVHNGDIFLRQKHIDYKAGQRDFIENNPVDERIVRAVWAMDFGFGDSQGAKALITNPGYLRLTYGQAIENDLLGENGKAPRESSTYEQEMSSRVEQLGKMLQSDIDDGAFTAGDILHDPFQRRRRIWNIQSANSVPTPTASIEELWRLDVSFYDSPELVGFLNRVRSKNPRYL